MLLDRGSITFADAPFFCHTSQGYILRPAFVEMSVIAVVVYRMLTSDKPNEQLNNFRLRIHNTFIPISHAKLFVVRSLFAEIILPRKPSCNTLRRERQRVGFAKLIPFFIIHVI